MRQFFSFRWMCARDAFWGNSAFANDWQWVFGNPAATALGTILAAALGVKEVTTGSTIWDAFLGAFAAFAITWLVAFLIRFFSLPAEYFHRENQRADKNEIKKGIQSLLNEIAELRAEMAGLRIEMLQDTGPQKRVSDGEWQSRFDALETRIATNIEQFATKAEADAYRTRGNLNRAINTVMGGFAHPLYIDLCTHDLDYLRDFIHAYSRKE